MLGQFNSGSGSPVSQPPLPMLPLWKWTMLSGITPRSCHNRSWRAAHLQVLTEASSVYFSSATDLTIGRTTEHCLLQTNFRHWGKLRSMEESVRTASSWMWGAPFPPELPYPCFFNCAFLIEFQLLHIHQEHPLWLSTALTHTAG